jgi:hypothetical protein
MFRFAATRDIAPQIATEICGAMSEFNCSCVDGLKHVVLLHQTQHEA